MARKKNEDKRQLILAEAKRMFAQRGYEGTSMGMLAEGIGIPVGSLYTYFDSKEDLLNTIIEDGWADFARYLEKGLAVGPRTTSGTLPGGKASETALPRLAFLVRNALPMLFEDADLISILLAQADRTSHLREKLEYIASLIASIIAEYRGPVEPPGLKVGLAVMLLGSLETMRLVRQADIGITADDVIAFLALTIATALDAPLPAV